jgi:orotidine-5'-phosphate decarboxylase
VISRAATWGNDGNTMFVVGATKAEMFGEIRNIIPDHFLLVPGVGAQGGSLPEVVKYGKNKDVGLLVNSSRGIIYASNGEDFEEKAHQEAKKLAIEMANLLR